MKDPRQELQRMKTLTDAAEGKSKDVVPKWSTVVALTSKVNEPMEERKQREAEATKLVRRLDADRRERERIRRLRAEENQLRIKEHL